MASKIEKYLSILGDYIFPKRKVAFIGDRHPLSHQFITNLVEHRVANIDFVTFEENFDKYSKVIIPNGFSPEYREVLKRIPPEKRVFIEVGFFPQLKNIYFDTKGIHGYSSVREFSLRPLTDEQRKELDEFRHYYTSHNFSKVEEVFQEFDIKEGQGKYDFPFIFVPLQAEGDTAYQLCPFDNNQTMVSFIESVFPDWKIIFKNHPVQPAQYKMKSSNILLPHDNRDLRELLIKARYIISGNSTVLLEALMHKKICASLGEGFSTNHDVCLECHNDLNRLKRISDWAPDWEKVDMFLYFLLQKQINIEFWKSEQEIQKLKRHLKLCGIISNDSR